MEVLKKLNSDTKKEIIVKLVNIENQDFTDEEVEQGLSEIEAIKIDEILIALTKTFPIQMEERSAKLVILSKYLGEEIINDQEVMKLLFTKPTEREIALRLVIMLLSNDKKLRDRLLG